MATRPTTAETLVAAVIRDELPTDTQTLQDYGFSRCRDLSAVVLLFEAYRALLITCGVTYDTLFKWHALGPVGFTGEIKRKLASNLDRIDGSVYDWVLLNDRYFIEIDSSVGAVNCQQQPSMTLREIDADITSRMNRDRYIEQMKLAVMSDPKMRRDVKTGAADLEAIVQQLADHAYGKETTGDRNQAGNGVSIAGTPTETLLAHITARKDSPELQRMKDYAMSRCHFQPERKMLIQVYTHLLQTCGVEPFTLHEWNAQGLKSLGLQVEAEITKKRDRVPAKIVEFVEENQWIWDAEDADGESRALFRTPDLADRFKDMVPKYRAMSQRD